MTNLAEALCVVGNFTPLLIITTFAAPTTTTGNSCLLECTVLVLRMAHRIWKETKQEQGSARPGNMLGCCLVAFHFLWAILSTSTVQRTSVKVTLMRIGKSVAVANCHSFP